MNQAKIPIDISPETTVAPKRRAPPGATDCHFHIFGPPERYELSPHRMYNPALAPVDDYLFMAAILGIERMVAVNGSPYGSDNSCTLDAIEEFGLDRARGVAVVHADISDDECRGMHERGVRGIRFNAITGRTPLSFLEDFARRVEPLGWHIQLWIKGERLMEVAPLIKTLPVPVVVDHMGQIPMSAGADSPPFRTLIRLLESGSLWVKLTAYRVSSGPPYTDTIEPARMMIAAAPDRCLWGTDWPHPYLEGRPMPNAGRLLDLLYATADEEQVRRILVDNPARLYGF